MREGYINSVLGEIPLDWKVEKFGSIFKYIKTYSFSRADLTFKNGHNNILYIHYGDIHATFERIDLDVKNESRVPVLIEPTNVSDCECLINGDLVIADASEDYVGVAKCIEIRGITDEKVIGGIHTIVARDEAGLTIEGFRCYLLLNKNVVKNIKRIATGTSVYGISKGNLSKLDVLLPPLPEQQKIAAILTTVDDKIENIDAQISEYIQLKKGLMKQLLTKGIGHTEYKDSVLGRIPKDWLIEKLDDLAEVIIDGTHFTPDYKDSGVPFLRITDIRNSVIDFSTIKYISQEEHELLCKRCKPQKGDILVSKNGTIGITKIVDWDWEFSIFVSLALIRIRPNLIYNRFLTYVFSSGRLDSQIKNQTKQGTVINLHLEEIRKFRIPLPSLDEQIEIANILSSSDVKLDSLNLQKDEYIKMKKGLMEQLLTGKLRVKV